MDKERRFEDSGGGGEVEKSFWRNSSATSVWVLNNKFALSSELKWKKATGKKLKADVSNVGHSTEGNDWNILLSK